MNPYRIKQTIKQYSILKSLLYPGLMVRRYWIKKENSAQANIHKNICEIFVDDPIVFINEFQGKFLIDVRSDLFQRLILDGKYEPKVTEYCIQSVKKNKDVIDVGANIGFFTILFATIIDDSQKVLSIEPTNNALGRLYENIRINEIENKVIVYEGVASNDTGTEKISVIEGKEEYSSIGGINHPSVSNIKSTEYEVQSSTIDDLVENFSLDPGFIKVDVEGAENLIFDGCKNTISKYRPIIISEISDVLLKGKRSSAKDLLNFFRAFDYEVINLHFPQSPLGINASDTMVCIPKETR